MRIEKFVSGKGIEKLYREKLAAHEIFNKKKKIHIQKFIKKFKYRLAKSLIPIIYILDPDAIIFGGGLSNEINFLR